MVLRDSSVDLYGQVLHINEGKNLSGHFLADSINPGTGEPHTSSAGTRKPGYCSHMAIS